MARPLTWRNIAINDGSSAASLGNSAAGFGRNAIQGLDIFSGQMQDRVNREDELLTNAAISEALRGGPTVSPNRRVDATALQQAVENRNIGQRAQESHTSGLTSDRLSQAGQRLTNEQNEFVIANQEADRNLLVQLDQARVANQQQSTRESQLRVNQLEDQIARANALRTKSEDLSQYLVNDRVNEFRTMFNESDYGQSLTPEQREAQWPAFREQAIALQESDPDFLPRAALERGINMSDFLQLPEGQQWQQARDIENERALQELQLQGKAKDTSINAARNYVNNKDYSKLSWNEDQGWHFVGSATKIDTNRAKVVAESAGLDPDNKAYKEVIDTARARFSNPAAFERVMSVLGDIKQRSKGQRASQIANNMKKELEIFSADTQSFAKKALNPTSYEVGGVTPEELLRNLARVNDPDRLTNNNNVSEPEQPTINVPSAPTFRDRVLQALPYNIGRQ